MDLYLPFMNGLQATEQIVEFLKKRGVEQLPYICLLTGGDTTNLSHVIRSLGIHKVVKKPIFKQGIQNLLIDAQLFSK